MSLINQMLKDLEKRRQQEDNRLAQKASVIPCSQRPRRWILSLFIVVALLVTGLVAGWLWRQSDPLPGVQPQVQTFPPPEAVVVAQPSVTDSVNDAVTVVSPPVFVVDPLLEPLISTRPALEIHADFPPVDLPDKGRVLAPVAIQKQVQLPIAPEPAVVVAKPSSLTAQLRKLRVQARKLIKEQRYEAAAVLLRQALRLDVSGPREWQELTVVYLRSRQLLPALSVADQGCQRYPKDSSLRVIQARLLVELGKIDQALATLQQISAPAVKTARDYYALLASLQQQTGDFSGAGQNYALLTEAVPERGDWWIGRAICADRLGQRNESIDYFKRALGCAHLKPQLKQYAEQQLTRLVRRLSDFTRIYCKILTVS